MSLDRLWAGWRNAYVTGTPDTPDTPAEDSSDRVAVETAGRAPTQGTDDPDHCVFCRIASSGPPSVDSGVLWVGPTTLVVLNAYPYSSGHLMAIPLRHVRSLGELTEAEGSELWKAARLGVAAQETAYGPDGINLGANLGEAAGAGIPRHLHLHAVPRWTGDTNFMTTVADTRVLPETLASSWERLTSAWPQD